MVDADEIDRFEVLVEVDDRDPTQSTIEFQITSTRRVPSPLQGI